MKTLILLRHAKSSWKHPELSDLERPLNKRGRRDAPRIGAWLNEKIQSPELVLCSPSVRTIATISKVGHAMGLAGKDYHTEDRLYHAGPEILEQIVHSCPEEKNSLLLVGHNPGLTEFANQLCPDHAVDNIPTCGLYAIRFSCSSWKEINAKNAEFLFFQYPKNLP